MSTTLGTTFACFRDFSPRFDIATTDREIVLNEVFHRLTCDTVLGDTDAARSFGYDVRSRLGARMSDEEIAALGPFLAAVLQRSGRLDSADVICSRLPSVKGLLSISIAVTVTTVTGDTFTFLFRLTGSTFEQVGAT